MTSEWKNGDLYLEILILDNLSSDDISMLNKKYGISGPQPGGTLILSHAINISQPLPDTTATAQTESINATATVKSYNQSIQATQSAQATNEAYATLQVELSALSEDFDSTQLSDKWVVYRPDPTKWDLTSSPGFLHIVGSPRRDAGILNIFGMRVTYADVEVITRIESNNMFDDRQSAWIAFTPKDYSEVGQTVELGLSFDDRTGYRIYMWACEFDSCFSPDSIGREEIDYRGSIYLKLTRIGNNYTGYYSYDGSTWIFVGEQKDFPAITNQITLGAGSSYNTDEFDAYFDFLHFDVPRP